MSQYFRNFPKVPYKFGNEPSYNLMDNLTKNSAFLSDVNDDLTYMQYYTIKDGDRPDTLSYKLYGTTDYHWTFYFMNEHIRESGWPLTQHEIEVQLAKNFPYLVVTSNCKDQEGAKLNSDVDDDNIGAIFLEGTSVTGRETSHNAIIVERHIDIGQFILQPLTSADTFVGDSFLRYNPGDGEQTLQIVELTDHKNGVHHYEDSSGTWIDINPFEITTRTPSGITTVTFEDNFRNKNEELQQIKVLRKEVVKTIASEYFKSFKR